MDPLSLSCNIIGVLTVAGKLLSFGYSYGNSVEDFPEDIQNLVDELSSLSGILHALKATMDLPDVSGVVSTKANPSEVARAITIPLEDCGRLLLDMVGDLEKYQKSGSKVQKSFKRLFWPLKEGETKIWARRIGRYKSTFSLALSADEMSLTRAIRENLERINFNQEREREENISAMQKEKNMKILQWLSSVDPGPNHRAAQDLRQFGTGGWLTEGEAYRDWFNAGSSFLWLYGLPGSGKTILSWVPMLSRSHVIDHILMRDCAGSRSDTAIAYFYCDFQERMKQTTAGLLGSVIAQLLGQLQNMKIPEEIQELYQQKSHLLDNSSVECLQGALPSIIRQFSKVIFVVDALDECANRIDFLESIKWFRNLEKVNLLVTSRDELDIRLEFEGLPSLMIGPKNITSDIELYIVNEIERQPKLRRLKQTMKSQIICSLVAQSDGMFRWVRCCLDQIGTLRNDRAIKAALVSLPRTLEGTYERILCQIPSVDKEMARGVLRWLVYNWRPMTIDQILEAVAVEVGETAIDPENRGNFPEDILDVCRGLTAMDDGSRKLRLAHFTVKEYLISIGLSQGPAADYYMPPGASNAELAKVCLTYLMFDDFGVGACPTMEELEDRHERYPLYEYAAGSLYAHISDYTKTGADEALEKLLLQFFLLDGGSGKFAAWSQANMGFQQYQDTHPKKTPLYCAAILGLGQAVLELLKIGADINGYCGTNLSVGSGLDFSRSGGRPLLGAIIGGHENTVRLLLENGANPNLPGNPNKPSLTTGAGMPIYEAGIRGRAKCLQILFDYGADEEADTDYGIYGKVIQSATWNGHQEVLEVLVNAKSFRTANDSVTPYYMLFLSAEAGFENIVRILLDRRGDMVVSSRSECRFFPMILQSAAESRRFKVIRILLQKSGIKAFCLRDSFFPGFLRCAAYGGEEKVIELLLHAKKNLSARDFGTALHTAAARGNVRAVECLLHAGASPCDKDSDGWTPVLCASQYQQGHCMEILMKGVENWDVADNKPICWENGGVPLTIETSKDGLEIHNTANGGSSVIVRAQRPITPLREKFYFEIQVISCSSDQKIGVGFGDKLVLSSWSPPDLWGYQPGHIRGSWGYENNGSLTAHDVMDRLLSSPYGTGAIVGCYLDRKSRTAVFTLNGSKSNPPFADVIGKLFPIVALGPGTHVRANFGGEPFVYEMPNLSAEEIKNAYIPNKVGEYYW